MNNVHTAAARTRLLSVSLAALLTLATLSGVHTLARVDTAAPTLAQAPGQLA